MCVCMRVMRAEQQHDSDDHQTGGRCVLNVPSLAEDWHGRYCSDEGSSSKESRLARRTQQPECAHVEEQADAIADESEKKRRQRGCE